MTDLIKQHPIQFPPGPVDGLLLTQQLALFQQSLAGMDIRYASNDFKGALVGNNDGSITVGSLAKPTGRTVGIPALVTNITNSGVAKDQTFVPNVSTGGKSSVQSVQPLTATSGASTSTISVASHNLQYGFGQVAYNSGSISGLSTSTLYYVYADDPTYAGGAVTYQATTNAQTAVAGNGRYYLGSITTPVSGSSNNISAATSANPIAFTTSTNHGWNTNDQVTFASLPGDFGTNLNGTTQTITVTGLATFTVAVDGHTYAAYTSGGTATRVTNSTQGGWGGGGGGNKNPLP